MCFTMPSKKQYNLVSDDAYDSRIPLYNEEAFQHGITFHAKYIGSLDVPRPSSRVEIVAAMRRIRYEFKAKSIKKRKVSITVSVDGVKVIPRSKRRNNRWPWEENKFIILHHPIYRIFYVSHDSQDLKIFSYIARDGGTNSFKCNVFKSKKKSQAMRIVRTIGQAFEVCHKLSLALATSNACEEAHSFSGNDEGDTLQDHTNKGKCQGDGASEPNSCDTQEETSATKLPSSTSNHGPQHPSDLDKSIENEISKMGPAPSHNLKTEDSVSIYHHIQLLKEQLEQQNQQMQSVVGQIKLLKDQLSAETNARLDAQAQNHHLLAHNRELLEHIKKLVQHIQEIEEKFHNKDKSHVVPHESFHLSLPSVPDIDSSFLQNPRYPAGSDKTSLSATALPNAEDQYAPDALNQMSFPNSYAKQLSIPSTTHHESSNNSKYAVSSNTGLSLPASPSSLTFSPNLDAIFKPDSFVCSSPKQVRKNRNMNPVSDDSLHNFLPLTNSIPHSPSFSQSSTSPGHKSKKHQIFDFPQVPSSYSSSTMFNFNSENAESDYKFNNNSHKLRDSVDPNSFEANSSNKDSFIAKVTRDLAKMSTVDNCLMNSSNSKSYGDPNFSLFKS